MYARATTDGKMLMTRVAADVHKTVQFGIYGAVGGALGNLLAGGLDGPPTSLITVIVRVGIWFGVIGACISAALFVGQVYYLKRTLRLGDMIKSGIGGFLAGLGAGALAQGVYSSIGATEVLRVICWSIAGGLLGYGLSSRIPNLTRLRGFIGGALGGVLGGCCFIAVAILLASDVPARVVGVAAIGFCIGVMIALVEAFMREAWLEIRYGPKEIRHVSLGSEPISLGSDQTCTIYVPMAPRVALRYRLTDGRVQCEDVEHQQTIAVTPGDRRVIGTLSVTVCAASQATAPRSSPPEMSAETGECFGLRLTSGQVISLALGARLSRQELPGLETPRDDGVVAEVVPHPQSPAIVGLRNLSQRTWVVTGVAEEPLQVLEGRSVRLRVGTRIDFGAVVGEIQ